MKARTVASFLDSIGVNVHLTQPTYAERFESAIKPRLKELGVRHIRDGLEPQDWVATRLKDLRANSGVKATLITSPTICTADQARAFVTDSIGTDAVAAIEGVNEVDGWFVTQVADWG